MRVDDESKVAKEALGPRNPDGSDPRYLGMKDALRREKTLEEGGLLKLQERATATNREDSFTTTESQFMEYRTKPLRIVVGYGLVAVVLLSARWWLWELDAALGGPMGTNLGWFTLCTMLCGAFCAFIAWPRYKSRGVNEGENDEMAKARNDFRRKFGR